MPDAFDDVLQISFDALPLEDDAESEEEYSPDDRFQVVDVEGEERISGLFEYDVVFEEPTVSSKGEFRAAPALPIDELTGTDVTLSFHRGDSTVRYVNGIVARLVHEHTSGAVAAADRQRYRVEIRPELWLLTLTNDYRSFAEKTVPDIVATILDEYQISYDEDSLDENLKDRYRPRKRCVQSGETTFQFLDGLLEEAGIFYFFRQEVGFHTIVFGDDNMAFPDAPSERENAPPVMRMGTSDQNDEETLWTGALEENVVPDGHRLSDTHFDGATTAHQRERGESSVDRKGRPLDVVDHPGGADRSTDDTPREHGPDILRRRLQQHRASKRLLRGVAPVRGLGTGQVFGLTGHDHGSINDTEFVTRRLFVEASPSEGYHVEYEAFPASTRFRGYRHVELEGPSERVRRRNSTEAQGGSSRRLQNKTKIDTEVKGSNLRLYLAKVVQSSDATKKEKGMVKVDFDWNEKKSTDEDWARLSQFLADPSESQSWGSQFVPRPGTKVLVAQDGTGSMDPIVLGCLYQGDNALPYPNDGDTETHSAIRTQWKRKDSDDNPIHNEIRFVDEKNVEEIGTFAPRKLAEATGFGEDLQGEMKIKVYKLKSSFSPSDFIPNADRKIGEDEYKNLSEKRGEAKCWLRPPAREVTRLPFGEYGHYIKYEGGTNKVYNSLRGKSVFVLKDKYRDKKDSFFKNGAPKEKIEGMKKYLSSLGRGEPKYTLKRESDYENLNNQGKILSDIPLTIGEDKFDNLESETKYEIGSKRKSGYNALIEDASKIENGRVTSIHDVDVGKDAYEEPVPTQECYELRSGNVGQDAYLERTPTQADYSEEVYDTFEREGAGAKRIEYTTGDPDEGVLEACNGSYRIHAHGSRLEIYRANSSVDDSSDPQEFFDQEFSEDWGPKGPGDEKDGLSRFEDDGPIVILNKDGGISIRADEGINIESEGDINIQSNSSINMRADNDITCYADDELVNYGDRITVGQKQSGGNLASNYKRTSVRASTNQEIREDSDKRSNKEHHWQSVQRGIWNDQVGLSNQQAGLTNSTVLISLAQVGYGNSKNLITRADTLMGTSNHLISLGTKVVKVESDIYDAERDLASKESEIVEIDEELLITESGVAYMGQRTIKKSK